MKKTLVSALTTALVVGAASTTFAAANPFADVPADHWAYDAVSQLLQDGIINGYGADGTFKGDQQMSRYEMAQIVAKAMAKVDAADNNNKALIDRLSAEFSDELANLGVRLADLEAKTDNVKWNGLIRYDWNTVNFEADTDHRDATNNLKLRFEPSMTINENWTGHARIDYDLDVDRGGNNQSGSNGSVEVNHLWAEGVYGKFDVKLGRFGSFSDNSHGLVMDAEVTGIEATYAPTSQWKGKLTAGRYNNSDLVHGHSYIPVSDEYGTATYLAAELDYNNGKWDGGVAYHYLGARGFGFGDHANNVDYIFAADKIQVVDIGIGYQFTDDWKATVDYAYGTDSDAFNGTDISNQAYSIQVNYRGADAAVPGSWGAYLAYRQLSPTAAFGATYDHKAGSAGLNTLKGFEIGADYAFAKNIVGTVKYFNGKDTAAGDNDKATGYWTRVDFMF